MRGEGENCEDKNKTQIPIRANADMKKSSQLPQASEDREGGDSDVCKTLLTCTTHQLLKQSCWSDETKTGKSKQMG